jgi:hypothetical protein
MSARLTPLWGIAAAAALLWPDRINSLFDGAPLDRAAEALLVGGVVPALWWFQPRFLATSRARVVIVALLVWRIASTMLFVQDGWCVQFRPARPFATEAGNVPHAWDFRADWRAFEPACSAVMTRSYRSYAEFPAWFFNLPPPSESFPAFADIPPGATTPLRVTGYLTPNEPGTLDFEGAAGVTGRVSIDGRNVQWPLPVGAGTHLVEIDAVLTYDVWALISRWNGVDLWRSGVTATLGPPSALDRVARPWIRWIPTLLVATLISMWAAAALSSIGSAPALVWAAVSSTVIALVAWVAPEAARWTVPMLALASLVRVPARLRNQTGAYALIGIPWLTFVLATGAAMIGKFRLYQAGNDYWLYQRFGYRIVMQGYWLEGGTRVFYFQPLYRWISGVLHAAFGDSSVGEYFWDGMCLLAGALVSFRIARAFAGFRWGIVAGVLPLAVFALSAAHYLIGYGLSEISSAGLLYLAALVAMRSRGRATTSAIAAGVLATFGFFTRLNNGIMAIGDAVFALPLAMPWSDTLDPRRWWHRVSWRTIAAVGVSMAVGLLFLAWRNWHYSGAFSVFYGTQRYVVAIFRPDIPLRTSLERLLTNLGRVLTVNDPPRFDVFALPVMAGAAAALLAIAGVPRFRRLPAVAVLFFAFAIAGSFVVYGFAYPGRFSIHLLPITCALTVCALSLPWTQR